MDTTAPQIGDNLPPAEADPLRDRLIESYADRAKRCDELLAGCERFPAVIADEETAKRAGDFSVKQVAAWLKDWEASRVSEKDPFLKAGRTVDGYFENTAGPLVAAKKTVDAARKKYADEKSARELKIRQEAERAAREAARAAEKAAAEAEAKIREAKDLDAAIEAEERAAAARAAAEAAAKAAQAKPAELSRTRGDHGSVTSLKSFPDFKDLNRAMLDLERLRQHFSIDHIETALRSFCRANAEDIRKNAITLNGVTLFVNTRL